MKIAFIIDSGFAHCEFSNNPLPIINQADEMVWQRNFESIQQILENPNPLFITESGIPVISNTANGLWKNIPINKRVLWILEPEGLIPSAYDFARKNSSSFKWIISSHKSLSNLENYKWAPFGGCWIEPKDRKIYDKTKSCSIICSQKNILQGHKNRHAVIRDQQNKVNNGIPKLEVFGRGYSEIENKIDGLRDFKYQIVIENESQEGYFTEKLIDCFLTGTVPIYMGAKDINTYFDADQMIQCDSVEAVNNAIESTKYINYKKWNRQINFDLAKRYILTENFFTEEKIIV